MWHRWLTFTSAVMLTASLSPDAITGQQAVPRVLRPPASTAPEEFTHVSSVRMLSDGRLLVADDYGSRLAVIDWTTAKTETIGRQGNGPGEYRSISRVLKLGGDSSLADDRSSLRWFVLERDRIVSTRTSAAGAYGGQGPLLCGADETARVCEVRPLLFRKPSPGHPLFRTLSDAESLIVLLADRRSARVDSVARIRGRFRGLGAKSRGAVTYDYYNPLAVEDQALLFPDGWMAIAHVAPYYIEWVKPDGSRIVGKPMTVDIVRLDEREKTNAIKMYDKNSARQGFLPEDFPGWPETLPPFHNDALLAAPDGSLIVRRIPAATSPATFYDVVNRAGALTERIRLEHNTRLVGFGARWAFVAVANDDELERVRRHPWP